MIRFATVGTSKITEHFLEAAALVPELEYDASFSRDAAKAAGFAENHGAKRHFSDMLRLSFHTVSKSIGKSNFEKKIR